MPSSNRRKAAPRVPKASKTTKKTTIAQAMAEAPVGSLVPMPNGRGALRNGGTNAGGPGRPRDEVRLTLLNSFDKRIPKLEAMADGHTVITLRARCEECGHMPDPKKVPDLAEEL